MDEHNPDLSEMLERLQKIERLTYGFLATTSHELRTPAKAIEAYTELLLTASNSNLTDQQKDILLHTQKSVQYLLQTLEDILETAKFAAGWKLDIEEAEFEQLHEKVVKMISEYIQISNHKNNE
ncbi:MAG: hypothetical protein HYR94_11595 [Chloroflexi bacterium]|nr:hypothetical protein [Chloroflexota bacterium]